MTSIPLHFQLPFRPLADPQAMVISGNARFTVLASRLIRLEYEEHGRFQDAPSQLVWYRQQPVPEFSVEERDGRVHIHTTHLHLSYQTGRPFTAESLRIELPDSDVTWHAGAVDSGNLRGTYRTLDTISGSVPLEPGLLSQNGWTVVDDSRTLIFREDGWLEPRTPEEIDWYFFGYGRDYAACLQDYARLTGAAPLLPRWALGNWWSRYWAYTQHELTRLMEEFR
ncbi:MAG TPA: glycoside hydrolase family 31 protein, partial [Chloroflexota bacterium]|nr:glycoside hydrolase family 31 protein [Chloroflexota bacterium]